MLMLFKSSQMLILYNYVVKQTQSVFLFSEQLVNLGAKIHPGVIL